MTRKERQRLRAAVLISDWRREAAEIRKGVKVRVLPQEKLVEASTLERCAQQLYEQLSGER